MNLYQLRYFSLLAQTGHFRKTANQLCIAQSSLSHAIALMEQELGVSLFEKQGRRSVLTPEGAEFLKYVEKSLGILDEGMEKESSNLDFCEPWAPSLFPRWPAAF